MTIDPHHDYQHCGGPDHCVYCRQILSETFEQTAERLTAENAVRGFRTGELRTGLQFACNCDHCQREDTTMIIPDPYRSGIEKLRTAQGITIDSIADDNDPRLTAMAARRTAFWTYAATSRRAARQPATSKAHLQPPNGYAEALKRMQEDR
jgi:hypothetical protein